jgi:hypothetical protein
MLAVAALAALVDLGAPSLSAAAVDARIQGTFAMQGRITSAAHVRGERKGQAVKRTWRFNSSCARGPCPEVVLHRERSAHHVDTLVLARDGVGSYSGRGRFYFGLRCAGRVYKHGGEARVRITVHVTRASAVEGQPFASAIRADYSNPRRINHTPCRGSLGRDGARYTGNVDAVPGPPVAGFSSSHPNPVDTTVLFQDQSERGAGRAPITSWSWSFGDPSSGEANSATAENPSHTFSAHGTYTVTLTVTDANGLTSTATQQLSV